MHSVYPDLYPETATEYLYYDGTGVRTWPSGTNVASAGLSSTARFFSIDLYDFAPRADPSTFSSIDPVSVSNISILNKADELANVVQAITSLTHVKDVIVISHSMGGLDARAYIEGQAVHYAAGGVCSDQDNYFTCSHAAKTMYTHDIKKLITLDTPHSGALTANIVTNIGGLCLLPGPCSCFETDTLNRRELQEGSYVVDLLTIHAQNPPDALTIAAIQSYTSPSIPVLQTDNGDGVVTQLEQSIVNVAPSVPTYYDISDYFGTFNNFYGTTNAFPLHILVTLGRPSGIDTSEH